MPTPIQQECAPIHIIIKINHTLVDLLVDTGADISTLSPAIAIRLRVKLHLHTSGNFIFADKSTLPRGNFTTLDLSFQGFNLHFSFDILDTTFAFDGICGRDLMHDLQASVNFPFYREPLPTSEAEILFPSHLTNRLADVEFRIKASIQHLLNINSALTGTCSHPSLPVTLPTIPGKSPTFDKFHRVSDSVQTLVDAWVVEALKLDIIELCPTNNHEVNFNNTIFPIFQLDPTTGKKDLSSYRMVLNPKHINGVMIPDKFPLPNTVDMRNALSKYTYFFELDLRKAFNQFALHPNDRYKSAFMVRNTRYMFKVLQFGFANGSSIFQKIMSDIFKDFTNVFIYVDNIIAGAHTIEHITDTITRVLLTLNSFNLKLNLDKSTICATHLNILGASISFGKIEPTADRLKEAADIQFPLSSKLLHSFLGLCGFIRPFIPNFANLVRPLEDLLQTTKSSSIAEFRRVSADPILHTAFDTVKHAIASPLTLNSILPLLPLSLITDASDFGVAAILFQPRDSGLLPSADNIVAIFTHKLSPSQINYDPCKKELLAVVTAIKHFDYLLSCNKFFIISDNQALTWPNSPQNRTTNQWFEFLLGFDFEISHIPGKSNFLADFFSRLNHPIPIPKLYNVASIFSDLFFETEIIDSQSQISKNPSSASSNAPFLPSNSLSVAINSLENTDTTINKTPLIPSHILYYVQSNPSSTKFYRTAWENFSPYDTSFESRTFHFSDSYIKDVPSAQSFFDQNFADTDLFYIDKRPATILDPFNGATEPFTYPDASTFIYSPPNISNLIRQEHARGHFATEAMASALTNQGFWWKNMARDLEAVCRACKLCAANNPIRRIFNNLRSSKGSLPWQAIQIDLDCAFDHSTLKFNFLLVVIDIFTDITFAFTLFSKSAEEVAENLKNLFVTVGIPKHVTSDGGREFDNKLLSDVFFRLLIEHHISIPYSFRGHGRVESKIKTIFTVIKKLCKGDTTSWHMHVPAALIMINLKIAKHTSLSPFQLFYGRDFAAQDSKETTSLTRKQEDIDKWIDILTSSSQKLIPLINQAIIKKQANINKQFAKTHRMAKPNEFKINDTVFIKSQQKKQKALDTCLGPYTIYKIFENGSYGLTQGPVIHERPVPISELKHFTASIDSNSSISTAKQITEQRGSKSRPSYKVLWSDESSSWEPESNIIDRSLITNFHRSLIDT